MAKITAWVLAVHKSESGTEDHHVHLKTREGDIETRSFQDWRRAEDYAKSKAKEMKLRSYTADMPSRPGVRVPIGNPTKKKNTAKTKYVPSPESKPRHPPRHLQKGEHVTRWGIDPDTGRKVLLHKKHGTKMPWHPIGQEHNARFGHSGTRKIVKKGRVIGRV